MQLTTKLPVWIQNQLFLLSVGGLEHPGTFELPLVFQFVDGDGEPLVVDSLHLLGSEVDQQVLQSSLVIAPRQSFFRTKENYNFKLISFYKYIIIKWTYVCVV